MTEFKPGWADATAKAVASGDEKTRAEALGHQPRRCFRYSETKTQQSRLRGAQLGRRKSPLPALFAEDEEK